MNRRYLLAACLVAMLANVPAGAQPPTGKGGLSVAKAAGGKRISSSAPRRDSSAELAAVRATSQAFASAFNRGDAKAVAVLWTPDGDYTDEAGLTLTGRAAIEKSYARFFANNRQARIRVIIDSLRLLNDNTAIEDGHAMITPLPAGIPAVGKYVAVHVKLDGKWLMATVRETRLETPSAYRKVGDLEWLVGVWTAEEHGVQAESVCRWVANKSFVERTYVTTQADGNSVSGVQLIGWNPARDRIQSWNFSSDGGHAVGVWSPVPGGWAAEIEGVTGEGVNTTAVNVLTRLDDNAYVWQSTQRTLGGTPLLDTEEVVFKRRRDGR